MYGCRSATDYDVYPQAIACAPSCDYYHGRAVQMCIDGFGDDWIPLLFDMLPRLDEDQNTCVDYNQQIVQSNDPDVYTQRRSAWENIYNEWSAEMQLSLIHI